MQDFYDERNHGPSLYFTSDDGFSVFRVHVDYSGDFEGALHSKNALILSIDTAEELSKQLRELIKHSKTDLYKWAKRRVEQ